MYSTVIRSATGFSEYEQKYNILYDFTVFIQIAVLFAVKCGYFMRPLTFGKYTLKATRRDDLLGDGVIKQDEMED